MSSGRTEEWESTPTGGSSTAPSKASRLETREMRDVPDISSIHATATGIHIMRKQSTSSQHFTPQACVNLNTITIYHCKAAWRSV